MYKNIKITLDPEIGEVFEFEDKKLKCMKISSSEEFNVRCHKCALTLPHWRRCDAIVERCGDTCDEQIELLCDKCDRLDGEDVYFKEVKEVK